MKSRGRGGIEHEVSTVIRTIRDLNGASKWEETRGRKMDLTRSKEGTEGPPLDTNKSESSP